MTVPGFILLISLLTAGLATVAYLIIADRQRFLIRFDLEQWRPAYYLRAVPNFLQALHDNHFRSPWPAKRNALSAFFFQWRSRPLLKRRPTNLRRAFLQQHITLFALLDILQPYLRDFFYSEQQRIIGDRILHMEDTIERDRLIEYLEFTRDERSRFIAALTREDRHLLTSMINRRFIPMIRDLHSIYQEHGYTLLREFSRLRDWEEMTGTELVQELPAYAVASVRKKASRSASSQI